MWPVVPVVVPALADCRLTGSALMLTLMATLLVPTITILARGSNRLAQLLREGPGLAEIQTWIMTSLELISS